MIKFAAATVVAMLFASTAFASSILPGGDNTNTNINQNANSNYNANGNYNSNHNSAKSYSSSYAGAAAGAYATGGKSSADVLNRQSYDSHIANDASSGGNDLTSSGDSVDAWGFSYVDAWFNLPVATVNDGVAITSWSVGVAGPLFKLGGQSVNWLPTGLRELATVANVAMTGNPTGTGEVPSAPTVAMVTAQAALCAKQSDFAETLAKMTSGFKCPD